MMTMSLCIMAQERQGEVLVHEDAMGDNVEEVEEEAAVACEHKVGVDPEKKRIVGNDQLVEAVEEEAEDIDLFKRKV